ncbi:MAG: pilus assembly PilX N-terminal domain-containing protein [Chlorobium sp.]|nr:pilus assembly PilX N-terminal domain-containing protein [Chlorobium sp.]
MMEKATFPDPRANEQGFVLVTAMVILVILTLIGITMTNTTVTEIQIAGNDKLNKQTFIQADGGTEAGSNLLEENISCPDGFSKLQIGGAEITVNTATGVTGAKLNFWKNEIDPALLATPVPYPSDTQRHIRIPNNDAVPHTNIHFFGNSELSSGSAIQMLAGYEGTGYSAATGGGQLVTNVDSQHIGLNNSESVVRVLWRHIIGHEGTCNY